MDTDHTYRYASPPSEAPRPAERSAVLPTSGGTALLRPSPHPYFFAGFLTRPAIAAEALRSVALVASRRYPTPVPPRSVRDPVVTCSGDRLRFEAFSACGGVLVRLDLLPGAFDGEVLDRGTTNVDINEPLRRFLSRVRPSDTVRMTVGSEELVVTSPGVTHVERKVRLPARWLRGFAEAQAVAATFERRLTLRGPDAVGLLGGLKGTATGWVVPARRGARLSTLPAPGGVYLAGANRLDALVPLLRHARELHLYGPEVAGTERTAFSGWEAELPHARLTVLLSPDPWQGFAGSGVILEHLAHSGAVEDATVVADLVGQRSVIDVDQVAASSNFPAARVRDALAHLALSGRVGYDLAEASYFHRELPYDPAAVGALSPQRLLDAEARRAAGAVRPVEGAWEVVSGERTYHVRQDGTTWSCTCRWWTTHHGTRGPCKHVLAVTKDQEGQDDAEPAAPDARAEP